MLEPEAPAADPTEIIVDPGPLVDGAAADAKTEGDSAEADKPAADATTTDDAPQGEEKPKADEADDSEGDDKPPEPTPFEKLVAETTDPEAKVAMIQRAMDGLSEEERSTLPALQAKLDTAKGDQAQTAMRQAEATRQAGVRQAEVDVASATGKINTHLAEIRTTLRAQIEVAKGNRESGPDTEGADDFDLSLINGALEEYVRGEVVLRDQGQRQLFSSAVVTRLHELGEPLTTEEFQEMAQWADSDEGKSRHQMIGAHLDKMLSRADARGFERGKTEGAEEKQRWIKTEGAAAIAEKMRAADLEPDTSGTKPATSGTLLKDMNADERAALSSAEIDAKMANEFSAA